MPNEFINVVLKYQNDIPTLRQSALSLKFLVRAPDSINGDGSAAAAGGAEILVGDNFEMTHCINLCYSLKFTK